MVCDEDFIFVLPALTASDILLFHFFPLCAPRQGTYNAYIVGIVVEWTRFSRGAGGGELAKRRGGPRANQFFLCSI
jgi:hypothetical protein